MTEAGDDTILCLTCSKRFNWLLKATDHASTRGHSLARIVPMGAELAAELGELVALRQAVENPEQVAEWHRSHVELLGLNLGILVPVEGES